IRRRAWSPPGAAPAVGDVTTAPIGAWRCAAAVTTQWIRREVTHMKGHAAITVNRPREEVERLWRSSEHRPSYIDETDAAVRFADAPGDRGTEIHVDLE